MAAASATADASALPLARNAAFPINLKFLAVLQTGSAGPTPRSPRIFDRVLRGPGICSPFRSRVRLGLRQSRDRTTPLLGVSFCHRAFVSVRTL